MPSTKHTQQQPDDTTTDAVFAAEKIRQRERRQRGQMPIWQISSFVMHCALVAALIWFTPLREIILKEDKPRTPAQLSVEKLESLSDGLQAIRLNEILRQLEDLQTLLHNMDFMKNEILKDYDEFAAQQQGNVKESLEKILDRIITEQERTVDGQNEVQTLSDSVAKLQKEDVANTNVVRQIEDARQAADKPFAKIESAQANSQNLLDRVAVEAELVGLTNSFQVAETLRDVQLKVNASQRQIQRSFTTKAYTITSELPRVKKTIEDAKSTIERQEANLKSVSEQLAKRMSDIELFTKQAEESQKLVEEKTAAQAAAKETLATTTEALEAANKTLETAKAEKTDDPAKDKQTVDAAQKASSEAIASNRTAKQKSENADVELRRANNQLADKTRNIENNKKNAESDSRRREQLTAAIEQSKETLAKQETRKIELEAISKDPGDTLRAAQTDAITAQKALVDNTKQLKELVLKEQATLEKLAQQQFQSPEVTLVSYAALDLVDAYEKAKELEDKIADSYRDIKSAEAAMLRNMSFNGARKMTDIAKTERPEFDQKLLRETPLNKETFDKQKNTAMDVVREVDAMVMANTVLMTAAAEIVKPETAHGPHDQQAQSDRLQRMYELAELNKAMTSAAAEDSDQRAKDMAALMGGAEVSAPETETHKDENDSMPQRVASGLPSTKPADAPALDNSTTDIIPGNVLSISPVSDGVPAEWMYVNSWYVIGPFPNPDRINLRRRFAPESIVDLEATYVGKNDKPVKWTFEQARSSVKDGRMRSVLIPQTQQEYGIWYAYSEVFVDRECDLWIAVGSDDRSDIWLNDMHVWGSSNELKSWRINEGFRRVHFQQGRNRILARIENGWHSIMWSVSIATSDTVQL